MPNNPTLTQIVTLARVDLAILHARKAIRTLEEKTRSLQASGMAADQALTDAEHHLATLKRTEISTQQKLESYQTRGKTAIRALEEGLGDPDSAQRQISQCEKIVDDLEVTLLETFEAQDTAKVVIASALTEIEHQALLTAQLQTEREESTPRLTALINEKRVYRTSLFGALELPVGKRYERLRQARGTAVARVIDQCCRPCQLALPMQDHSDLNRGREVHCRKCGRWLFIAD